MSSFAATGVIYHPQPGVDRSQWAVTIVGFTVVPHVGDRVAWDQKIYRVVGVTHDVKPLDGKKPEHLPHNLGVVNVVVDLDQWQ